MRWWMFHVQKNDFHVWNVQVLRQRGDGFSVCKVKKLSMKFNCRVKLYMAFIAVTKQLIRQLSHSLIPRQWQI